MSGVLCQLNPDLVLASVGQYGNELPNAGAHACRLGIKVEQPLAVRKPKLISCGRGTLRRCINRRSRSGRVTIFDGLKGMNPLDHWRAATGCCELYRNGAAHLNQNFPCGSLRRNVKTHASCYKILIPDRNFPDESEFWTQTCLSCKLIAQPVSRWDVSWRQPRAVEDGFGVVRGRRVGEIDRAADRNGVGDQRCPLHQIGAALQCIILPRSGG